MSKKPLLSGGRVVCKDNKKKEHKKHEEAEEEEEEEGAKGEGGRPHLMPQRAHVSSFPFQRLQSSASRMGNETNLLL